MSDQHSRFDGIGQVATVTSELSHRVCDECGKEIHGDYSDIINHYLGHDTWVLLHIGSETAGYGSSMRNLTVAMLGKLDPDD